PRPSGTAWLHPRHDAARRTAPTPARRPRPGRDEQRPRHPVGGPARGRPDCGHRGTDRCPPDRLVAEGRHRDGLPHRWSEGGPSPPPLAPGSRAAGADRLPEQPPSDLRQPHRAGPGPDDWRGRRGRGPPTRSAAGRDASCPEPDTQQVGQPATTPAAARLPRPALVTDRADRTPAVAPHRPDPLADQRHGDLPQLVPQLVLCDGRRAPRAVAHRDRVRRVGVPLVAGRLRDRSLARPRAGGGRLVRDPGDVATTGEPCRSGRGADPTGGGQPAPVSTAATIRHQPCRMRSAGGSGASGVGLWLRRLLGVRAGRARLPGMNPFLTESPLPYQLPDFTAIAVEHFAPALEEGMAQQRDEVAAITAATEPATFADTVDALERSGAVLRRVTAVLSHLTSADTNDALREIEATWKPRLTAHRTAILTDEALFARIDQQQRTADELGLTAEQRHLVQRLHTDFRRAGAGLARDVAARVAEIDTELSELTTRFGNALLDESNARALHLTEEAELDGLDDAQRAAARAAAADRGLDGWLLTLVLPTPQPALASLRNREVRRRLHEAAVGRGIPAGGDLAVRIA